MLSPTPTIDNQAERGSSPPTVLTTPEAAHYLGLATSTLNKWRCHGGGPMFIKLGRAVRYRQEDLNTFLTDSAKRSTSDVQ